MLGFLIALAALLIGSLLLSLVYEGIAGNESFSLPFSNLLIVTVLGAVLYAFFGFAAVAAVLGIYGVWWVGGGLIDRRSTPKDE